MNCVVIPVKALAQGKSRLSACLTPDMRRLLSQAMLRDVLKSACQAPMADGVAVVSSDPALLAVAQQFGAMTIHEGHPRGLNGAATIGTDYCLSQGATAVLVLLADLPLVTAEDVELLFQSVDKNPNVILVPCKEGEGTNALLRVPPLSIPTCFGGPSLAAHQAAARQHDVPCQVLHLPRVAFDLDTIEDLRWLARQPYSSHTTQALKSFSITAATAKQ